MSNQPFSKWWQSFVLLIVLLVSTSVSVVLSQKISTTPLCYANSGWTWEAKPANPEIIYLVQQSLHNSKIIATVKAMNVGETDSCGVFKPYAVDFTIALKNNHLIKQIGRQGYAERIQAILVGLRQFNVGNIEIQFPQGNAIYLRGETTYPSQGESTTEYFSEKPGKLNFINTQVDAKLAWQQTTSVININDSITIEVVNGLWTHQIGVAPYNNGTGGNYICSTIYPPEQCVEPLPQAPQGALIGKIGNQIFEIGNGTTITANQTGTLYLRINDGDNGLSDNDGILTVAISDFSEPATFTKRVYAVVYDPLLNNGQLLSEYLNWYRHEDLTQGTIDFFQQASNNDLTYVVVETTVVTNGWPEKVDGFRYTEEEYLSVINNQIPAHQPDAVNYNKIVNDPNLDICGKVNRGEIDEVWVYNGPYFGFYESTLVGPGAYWYNSPPVPGPYNCNRLIPIMGPSPERGLDSAIHNFGHRTESTLTQVYGSWQQNRTAHNWERFALVDALSSNFSYSGCGNIHFPPNGTSDYDYGNSGIVSTTCEDFKNYPNLGDPTNTIQPVSCSKWGCDGIGYYDYWFYHLPNYTGCGSDNVANNWWRYLIDPSLALDPASICQQPPTATATHTSTPTATATSSPTATVTRTPTPTATATSSPTVTSTATATRTPTQTTTVTSSPTATSTAIANQTLTPTATTTPSMYAIMLPFIGHQATLSNIQVDAELPWQMTSLAIGAGDTLVLKVISGLWTHQTGVAPYNNGTGGDYVCTDFYPPSQCVEPMPEVPQGALVGKIGSHIFAIRNGTTIVARQSGRLYLRMNDGDNGLFDNDGILTLDVDILP